MTPLSVTPPPPYSNCNYSAVPVTAVPQYKLAVQVLGLYGINRYCATTPRQRRRLQCAPQSSAVLPPPSTCDMRHTKFKKPHASALNRYNTEDGDGPPPVGVPPSVRSWQCRRSLVIVSVVRFLFTVIRPAYLQ